MKSTANLAVTSTVANGIPCISSSNQSTSYGSYKSGQRGWLQTIVDNIRTGLGYCIQLSVGSHTIASSIVNLTKENYIMPDAKASLFAPTTVINGSLVFSVSGYTIRIKIKDCIISGTDYWF